MQLLYLAVDEDDGGEKKIAISSFLRAVLYYHIDLVPIPENCSYLVTLTSASLHQQIKYTILRLHQSLYNFIQTGVLSENKKLSGRIKAEAMMSSLLQLQP